MSSLFEALSQQLGGDTLRQMAGQLGTDERTAGAAMSAALPLLLGALGRNSASPEGASALFNAVSKDHDGSILDDLAGHLRDPQAGPGDGILRHVLGGKRNAVEAGVSKATGMPSESVGRMLVMLAPVVMGALGKAQRQQGMNARGLAGLLGQEHKALGRTAGPQMGALSRLLDADGDGDLDLGDLASHGAGLLSGLFKRG